jgi:hypothetical protein
VQPDLSEVQFNKNHKTDSSALEAIFGIRLILVSFFISFALSAIAIGELPGAHFLPQALTQIPSLVILLLWLVAFGCGAYGTYSVISSLGWSGIIGFLFIAPLLIPYFNLVVLIVVAFKAFRLIGSSIYKFSLFGKVEKRA